jgi:hypothetical protein
VVGGLEECDPPDGITCDGACNAIYPPEAQCNDLVDDDNDGLTDCEDPTDCKSLADCVPGATPTGEACSAPSECLANDTDPICFSEAVFGFPQGYCSEFCDASADDCAPGATCVPTSLPSGAGLCFASCVTAVDCRPGYSCASLGGALFCYP